MSTISETINDSLFDAGLSSYADRARPVIQALEQRETQIIQQLIHAGTGYGLERMRVIDLLESAGMDVRSTSQSSNGDSQQDSNEADANEPLASQVSRLANTVGNLVEFARRHGFSG